MNFRMMILTILLFLLLSCTNHQTASLIIKNAHVYTLDSLQPFASSIAIDENKIIYVGDDDNIEEFVNHNTEIIDAEGRFVMPGLIEGHGHFSALGNSLVNLNLLNYKSWEQIVDSVKTRITSNENNNWIMGRGWHQEKWDSLPAISIGNYPTRHSIDSFSIETPIILYHASGHALFANQAAMAVAGISIESPNPAGGKIIKDQNGNPTGIFEENAMKPFAEAYENYRKNMPTETEKQLWSKAINLAQEECIKSGVTSFEDAGSKFFELRRYRKMAQDKQLKIRLWAMARHSFDELKDSINEYVVIGEGDNFYTCNAIKSELDGALGSHGAWLLAPYSDMPGFYGQNTTPVLEVKRLAELAKNHDMQFCVHAIGDRANRTLVDLYDAMLSHDNNNTDRRWRVEHAQHLDTTDIPRIAALGIIASMQGIHCTSDAPFVEKRLGYERSKNGAYAWRRLLDAGVKIANGTDVPIENLDPFANIYASVTRKRIDNQSSFFPEQKMTRSEALKSYTLDNAYAAFQEDKKGSIEVGKLADIIILDTDILNCNEDEIPNTTVLYTIIDGKVVFKR
ncbi:MAG TPA: amidohydrolase [Saprospiraceae bacterium]|nr:amidohydrolase [Saprospiraceae bacterium]HPK08693.1 amidohydrolase [Saprospiraceae bacterium]HPQ20457.1 amidohydrolase [Saprospiraceae bacterium]HRX28433.1 amidohydrolase [Saprospiraceae bacterium]